ncbi:TPA: hypothetical protein O7Y00_002450 [Salmonella enterica]|nr:hypothetical protein [Salmonella enterica]HDC2240751.1 hypothetical protein [Salmonella enterica]
MKQVAEMRPFLLDGITGVKKLSYKPINLLKFLFILGRIPLLCDRFLFANNGKAQKVAAFWAHKKHWLECFLEISIGEITSSVFPCKAFDAIFFRRYHDEAYL